MVDAPTISAITRYEKPDSFARRSFRALRKNRVAVMGLILVSLIIVVSIIAPVLAPYDPIKQSLRERLQPPSATHWLGTDEYGRDILSRIIWGGRSSLFIGFASCALALVLGSLIGMTAGYFGGTVDTVLMRIMDWLLAFPLFLLALVVIATLGANAINVVIAIGISAVPRFARVVRSQTIQLKNELFIDSARVSGCTDMTILVRHILPNNTSGIIVLFTVYLATAILVEASLSFLGMGPPPPTPSWGLMVSSSRGSLLTAPWALLFPGLAITLTVLGLNLFGDGLRDALDPRLS